MAKKRKQDLVKMMDTLLDERDGARVRRSKKSIARKATKAAPQKPPRVPKVGKPVGVRKLAGLYDRHASAVLEGLGVIEAMPRSRGAQQNWIILKELPTAAEYRILRDARHTRAVAQLMDDAYSELESVGDELRSWHDNMPENLQYGDLGSRIEEAASVIEGVCSDRPYMDGDVGAVADEVSVVFLPCARRRRHVSRSDRLSDAADMLSAAADALKGWCDTAPLTTPDEVQAAAEVSEAADTCSSHVDDIGSVDVPGMYG